MKWFKHESDAHRDAKIRKLRRRHGLEAVGLYWTLLEMIVADLERDRFTFELEQDAEMISEDTGLSRDQVESMMKTMLELGLFECSGNVITCFKLLRRMDSSQVKDPAFRKLIVRAREAAGQGGHDRVMTPPCPGHGSAMIDEMRSDEISPAEGKISTTGLSSTTEGADLAAEEAWG